MSGTGSRLLRRFLAGSLALACASAVSATPSAPVTVDFSGNCTTSCGTDGSDGNSRTFTFLDGQGLTSRVMVTAWSATQSSSTGALSNYQTAFIGEYSGGLGVTNRNEGDGSSNNGHIADNVSGIDMIVLRFDGNVVVTGAQLNAFAMTATGYSGSGSDTDASFYVGTTSVAWGTAVNMADSTQRLSIMTNYMDTLGGSGSNYRNVNTSTLYSGNVFVITPSLADWNRGTSGGNRPDGFKVDSIKVEYLVAQAPEPAAIALFGAGLLGLGALRRRRRA